MGNANACGDAHRCRAIEIKRAQIMMHCLGNFVGQVFAVGAVNADREIIATNPRNRDGMGIVEQQPVSRAKFFNKTVNALRQFSEQAVADLIPHDIANAFEAIKFDHHQARPGALGGACSTKRLGQLRFKHCPVGQASDWVTHDVAAQLGFARGAPENMRNLAAHLEQHIEHLCAWRACLIKKKFERAHNIAVNQYRYGHHGLRAKRLRLAVARKIGARL